MEDLSLSSKLEDVFARFVQLGSGPSLLQTVKVLSALFLEKRHRSDRVSSPVQPPASVTPRPSTNSYYLRLVSFQSAFSEVLQPSGPLYDAFVQGELQQMQQTSDFSAVPQLHVAMQLQQAIHRLRTPDEKLHLVMKQMQVAGGAVFRFLKQQFVYMAKQAALRLLSEQQADLQALEPAREKMQVLSQFSSGLIERIQADLLCMFKQFYTSQKQLFPDQILL